MASLAVKLVLKGVKHKRLGAMDSALPLINGKGCRRIKISKLTSTAVDLAVVKYVRRVQFEVSLH